MSDGAGSSKLWERDSSDYGFLAEGVALAPEGGLFMEIGLRRGGGMKVILDGLLSRGAAATVIACDCYGHMPYMVAEDKRDDFDYTNDMRNETIAGIFEWLRGKPVNFLFFNMTDEQFFVRFADGVPIYIGKNEIIMSRYSLVHVDGQHSLESVLRATRWLLGGDRPGGSSRMLGGGLICYDDISNYNHDAVERILFAAGYEGVRLGGKKGLYRRLGQCPEAPGAI